jgi:glycosyltransferase involved in cell wall biosynthesis
MKILIDAHVFDGKFQGTRTYIKGIYNELIWMLPDWEFIFIANEKSSIIDEFPREPNVRLLTYSSTSQIKRLLIELPEIIQRENIDFAHFQYIAPIQKRCKHIITNHDILFKENRFKSYFPIKFRLTKGPFFEWSSKQSDILLTVSEYSKKQISSIYSINSDNIQITPNAVSQTKDWFANSHHLEKRDIIFVSRIEPRKNHVGLIRAFLNLELDKKGYRLVLVGKYDLNYSEYDKILNENKERLSGVVLNYSGLNEEDLKKKYESAALAVFPSFAEGFGVPPLEAAMLGVKVVCSNTTAMEDFDFFRYKINPSNQKELEDSILEALNDTDYPFEEIRNVIQTKYNWKLGAKVLKEQLLKFTV